MRKNYLNNRRVIVIDDNESIHEDFRSILGNNHSRSANLKNAKAAIFGEVSNSPVSINFEIDSAFQGQEGLDKIRQALKENRPYAMAFIDMRMPPGWDGIETIRNIWNEYPELEVVICTAYSDYEWDDIIDTLEQNDQLLILKKPFDNVEVYQLASALTEKWNLARKASLKMEQLKQLVRQRTKALRIAKKQAEEASNAKGQFLANMSHEIRTPLNSVIGLSELLAEEKLSEEQAKYVNLIRISGKNLIRIINDILDFSKIESGKFDIDMTLCSIQEILTDINSMMHLEAQKKNLKFEISRSDELPMTIRTDPTRLRQCLINLISNAIKFTEKGHVRIYVSLEYSTNGNSLVRFNIEDTGIGIKRQDFDKLFISFIQADGSISRKYGGTGLGLAITKQLANLLGGDLTFNSEEGRGSTFSLVIPVGIDLSKQQSLYKQDPEDQISNYKKNMAQNEFCGCVLVAEDVEANQVLIKAMLNRMGLEVTIAVDGHEAVQKALSEEFDLIFMDIQMPRMDGYEATKILRKKGVTIPIIALTAHAMKDEYIKCVEIGGCDHYLTKPVERQEIMVILRKYLPFKGHASLKFDRDRKDIKEISDQENRKLINIDHLINIIGDEKTVREVIPAYINDNEKHFIELTEAIKKDDTEAVMRHAHAIKGAGRNFGAIRLAYIADQLECAGRKKDMTTVSSSYKELKREFEKVLAFISKPDWFEISKQQCNINTQVLKS